MPRQREPMKYRYFVKDENGNYVDMSTLSEEEQKRHRSNITDRIMAQFGFERDEHPEQPARQFFVTSSFWARSHSFHKNFLVTPILMKSHGRISS